MSIFGKIVSAIRSLVQGDLTREQVEAKVTAAAERSGEKLEPLASIVDLLKALDMDSGLDARRELAEELGYTGALDGSAAMNMWLHAQVMKRIADHYIDVPGDANTRPA